MRKTFIVGEHYLKKKENEGKEEKNAQKKLNKIMQEEQKESELFLRYKKLLETTFPGKLMLEGKPFIIVAIDAPYFLEVYKLIRKTEMSKGTWSDIDEKKFRELLDQWFEI